MKETGYRDLEAYRMTRSLVVEALGSGPGAPDRDLERAAVRAAMHLVDGCRAQAREERERHLRASLEAVVALRRRLEELSAAGHLPDLAAAEMLAHQKRTEELLDRFLAETSA